VERVNDSRKRTYNDFVMFPAAAEHRQRYSRCIGAIAILLLQLPAARAQAKTPMKEEFESATVKPTASQTREPIGWLSYPGGRLVVTNCTLSQIVALAWGVDDSQVSGGRGWVDNDHWDITAKAPSTSEAARQIPKNPKSLPSPEMLRMLQSLLSERFQLKLHSAANERSGYSLIPGSKGPLFAATKNPETHAVVTAGVSDSPDLPQWLQSQNATMADLAARLTTLLRRPVQDNTGVRGDFAFKVEYSDADSLPAALQQQLGLRLVGSRIETKSVVIEAAEKPSEN
jgi:uncharacterized protein (TIGR03435 family)